MSGVATPCIGVCSTVLGDSVCRGCRRYAHEIVQWNRYTDAEKRLVLQRLDDFLARVLEPKLQIVDADALQRSLRSAGIAYSPERAPCSWVLELLRHMGREPVAWRAHGLRPLGVWAERSPARLRDTVATEFHTLSEAHYERYVCARQLMNGEQALVHSE